LDSFNGGFRVGLKQLSYSFKHHGKKSKRRSCETFSDARVVLREGPSEFKNLNQKSSLR